MDALKQLEFRILEELSDVHEIQKKLVKSKLAKGQEPDSEDFFELHQSTQARSRAAAEADAYEKSPVHGKSRSKSRFWKNPNMVMSPKKSSRSNKENSQPANPGPNAPPEPRNDRSFQPSFNLLHEKVRRWIWERGWHELRDLQNAAIRPILAGSQDEFRATIAADSKRWGDLIRSVGIKAE